VIARSCYTIRPGKRDECSGLAADGQTARYSVKGDGHVQPAPCVVGRHRVAQAIVNVIDHQMPLQTAFEAPRMWDRGPVLELEQGFPGLPELRAELERRGHVIETPERVAGGMNGIMRRPDGMLEGAACWRADGAPLGYSGGDGLVDDQIGRASWR
jgi:hypothetical protein